MPPTQNTAARTCRASSTTGRSMTRILSYLLYRTRTLLSLRKVCRLSSPSPLWAPQAGRGKGSHPRPRRLRLLLVARDLVLLLQREADVVEPVQQAVLAVRVDGEFHHAAVRPPDLLF